MYVTELWYRDLTDIVPVICEDKPNNKSTSPNKRSKPNEAKDLNPHPSYVLIIEDELIIAENMKEVLEKKGLKIAGIVASGEEAIEKFSQLKPDLLLMDIRLSGAMDGVETALKIHSTLKQVPVVFVSAYTENQFPHLSELSADMYRFLSKPVTADQLVATINTLLANH